MDTISHSRRLRQHVERAMPELSAATTAIVMHANLRELYIDFATAVHQLVRATVPLMRTALRRCRELERSDPLAVAMAPYYEHHIKEEMHHDEWLLEDLESIGVSRESVFRPMPSPAVASLIGSLYYWIEHHHPVAQLGQIASQEGYPPQTETIDLMVARSGYPRSAFRTLEKHGQLDVHHRNDFDAALDDLPLTDDHHEILKTSAIHTVRMAAHVYREVIAAAIVPLKRSDLVATPVGSHSNYRLEDLSRGTVYDLGEQEHYLLTQCDGRQSPHALREQFETRFKTALTRDELNEFLRMARAEEWFIDEAGPSMIAVANE